MSAHWSASVETTGPSRCNGTLPSAALVRACTTVFLFSMVLDGPLRYLLAANGLVPVIYLPKILLMLAIPYLVIGRRRISKGFVAASAILSLALIWGAANLPSVAQALFGLWVLVPLLYGSLVMRDMFAEPNAHRRLFRVLFVIAATGVLLNPVLNYPWVGASLDIGGISVEVSRLWDTAGLERSAGFARASFSAASQLLVFAIWLVATGRSRWHKLAIWLVAGAGIAVTTSKGPAAAWLLLSLFFLSGMLLRFGKSWRRVWVGVLFLVLAVVVVLPLTTVFVHYAPKFDSPIDDFLFASFGDRLNRMWPNSLALLQNVAEWFIGRGLGGIGAAQQYFEPSRYLAADNLFVYVAVDIGPLASGALLMILTRRISRIFLSDDAAVLAFAIFMFVLVYGLVTNVVEEPLLAFLLGAVASMAPERKKLTAKQVTA